MPPFLGGKRSAASRSTASNRPTSRQNSRPALRRSSPPSARAPSTTSTMSPDAVTRHEQDSPGMPTKCSPNWESYGFWASRGRKSAIVSLSLTAIDPCPTSPSSIGTAWRSAPATIARCRCTSDSESTPPPGRVSTSTIHAKRSTSWPGRSSKSGKYSGDGPEDGRLRTGLDSATLCPGEAFSGRTSGSVLNPWG